MPAARRPDTPPMLVATNQLHLTLPPNWQPLLQQYSIWRYRLSPSQDYYRREVAKPSLFYASFTNAYKAQIDQPFYYFSHDTPQSSLYTLLPVGEQPKAWLYTFGDPSRKAPEAISGELIADPKTLRPDVLVKLLLALSFYESGLREKARRVCQSNFYLLVRSNPTGKRLFAAEIDPKV